jgi:hypothetical protein
LNRARRSDRSFKDRTKELDELLADPELATAVRKRRSAFEEADREYAAGLHRAGEVGAPSSGDAVGAGQKVH